jgi:hypothetical protein
MTSTLTTKRTFLIVLFLGLFALAARNVIDPDLWWHLRTGEFIAQHRSVPHTDPFSCTRAGYPWVTHEWLTEVGMYELQLHAGFAPLILLFAAITAIAFFLLYLRCGPAPYLAGIATLVAAWATAPLWGVRPQILSLLLTSLWLLILERAENNPKLLWWTLPLTLLWVNLHAGFALGLVLSALFLAGELVERRLAQQHSSFPKTNAHLPKATLILLLDLFLVPLNPNGLRMFAYPIETLRSTTMQNYIAEWASPNFHRPEYWPFLLIILASFATLCFSRIPLRRRDLILLLVALYASLISVRMIPLFVLIGTPLFVKRLGNWPRTHPQPHKGFHTSLNAVIILATATFAIVRFAQVIQRQPETEAREFPARAVGYFQQHPPAGPIFNLYDWGGYLIWKLYPKTHVFIDGRADLYGPELLHNFADVYQFKGSWQQILQRWHIQTVIIPPASALAIGLQSAPGWTIAYEDSQAIILTKLPGTASTYLGTAALGCPLSQARSLLTSSSVQEIGLHPGGLPSFPQKSGTAYSPLRVTLVMQLITLLSTPQAIMVYILDNPPQDNASNRYWFPGGRRLCPLAISGTNSDVFFLGDKLCSFFTSSGGTTRARTLPNTP